MILGVVGDVALGRFMPESDVCCRLIVVVVLYVFGDVLKLFCPVQGVWWWRCWRVDPHGDETVGWVLHVVINEEEIPLGSGKWNDVWFYEP